MQRKKKLLGPTTLILVRHGQGTHMTKELSGKTIGRAEWAALTTEGRRQIAKTAKHFRRRNIDVMIVSPLQRTRESAKVFQKYVTPKKIVFEDRIVEKSAGDAEGGDMNDMEKNPHKYTPRDWRYFRHPNGESWHDLFLRIRPFLRDTLARYEGKTILIIGHGHVNRAILYLLTGLRLDVWVHQYVACSDELVIQGRHVIIKELNAHDETP